MAPYAWPVAAAVEAVDQILNAFNVFGGGGGPPPWIAWKLTHQGGNLQLWAQIDGIDPAWAPNWSPTAGGIELTQSIERPTPPEYRNYSPASGSVGFGACVGTLLAFSAPTVVACGVSGSLCVGGGLPACAVAFGTCGAIGFGAGSCYAQAHGGNFPNPGDELGQLPPGDRSPEPPRPEPPLDETP